MQREVLACTHRCMDLKFHQSKAQIFYTVQLKEPAVSQIVVHGQCKVERGHKMLFTIDSNWHRKPHHVHAVLLRSSLRSADAACIGSGVAAICKKHFLVFEKKRYQNWWFENQPGMYTCIELTIYRTVSNHESMGHLFRQYLRACHGHPSPSDWAKTYHKIRTLMHCDFSLCWRVTTF